MRFSALARQWFLFDACHLYLGIAASQLHTKTNQYILNMQWF